MAPQAATENMFVGEQLEDVKYGPSGKYTAIHERRSLLSGNIVNYENTRCMRIHVHCQLVCHELQFIMMYVTLDAILSSIWLSCSILHLGK